MSALNVKLKKKCLTHRPTVDFQPIIESRIHEFERIVAPLITIQFDKHAPAKIIKM